MIYIAYGSNMNIEQMAYRCPNSRIVGTGRAYGWQLVFNVHADIVETNNDKDFVPIVLWDIADDDWDMLDIYEGYPDYYIKREIAFEFDDGTSGVGIVYVMADNRKGICPPYGGYFEGILTGYIENDIDTDYLYDALTYSWNNETRHNQYNPV